jgi:hypothetical protein
MNEKVVQSLNICLSYTTHNTLSSTALRVFGGRTEREIEEQELSMPTQNLPILCGASACHRRTIAAPTSPPPPPPSIVPHRRVLELPPSPSPDRPAYRPIESSDPDASPWGHWGQLCAIHDWGPCPNRVAQIHVPSPSGRQGRRVEKKKTTSTASR